MSFLSILLLFKELEVCLIDASTLLVGLCTWMSHHFPFWNASTLSVDHESSCWLVGRCIVCRITEASFYHAGCSYPNAISFFVMLKLEVTRVAIFRCRIAQDILTILYMYWRVHGKHSQVNFFQAEVLLQPGDFRVKAEVFQTWCKLYRNKMK